MPVRQEQEGGQVAEVATWRVAQGMTNRRSRKEFDAALSRVRSDRLSVKMQMHLCVLVRATCWLGR